MNNMILELRVVYVYKGITDSSTESFLLSYTQLNPILKTTNLYS